MEDNKMAALDKMHDMTIALALVIDRFDSRLDEEFDCQNLRDILQQLFIHLSACPGFKKALANAHSHDRSHEEWERERKKDCIKNIMYEIESLVGYP